MDKGDKNEYLSFIHNMKKGGAHELVVYVDVPCQKRSFHIHLAEFKVPYKITNYDRKGNVERVCLNLHKHIEDEFGNKCKKFQVIFEGYAAAKKLCVNDLFYLRKSDVMKNGKWKGHPKCRESIRWSLMYTSVVIGYLYSKTLQLMGDGCSHGILVREYRR